MVDNVRVGPTGVYEKTDTSGWVGETLIFCPDCGRSKGGHLWVRSYVDEAANLACATPGCGFTNSIPKGTENLIKK